MCNIQCTLEYAQPLALLVNGGDAGTRLLLTVLPCLDATCYIEHYAKESTWLTRAQTLRISCMFLKLGVKVSENKMMRHLKCIKTTLVYRFEITLFGSILVVRNHPHMFYINKSAKMEICMYRQYIYNIYIYTHKYQIEPYYLYIYIYSLHVRISYLCMYIYHVSSHLLQNHHNPIIHSSTNQPPPRSQHTARWQTGQDHLMEVFKRSKSTILWKRYQGWGRW